jgi:hypothetical protein
MQKAHLYEAILLVNRGVDEAVLGPERLKRIKDPQLDSLCFDVELVLFEDHRGRLNSYFCIALQRTLDEVQPYGDVRVVEDRRRVEGKPPKVRFFSPEEQRKWERRYPRPPGDVPWSEGEAKL